MVNWDRTPWNAGPGELPGDDADEMARAVQCDNCGTMFDRDDEDAFIGWHSTYGDCCQCAKCRYSERANFPFSGSF
jgi:ssDNA-binding Zn-finger/Zn-ribbon topoisomerase 1